jgi:hypothetical protein
MFIGHLAIGFGAKKAAPRASLGWLLLAAVWCDVVFAVLLFLGIERVRIDPSVGRLVPIRLEYFPWSHSLLMTFLWAVLLGGIYYAVRRYRDGAVWTGLAVLSHWLTDWASHRPDMPLIPGSLAKYGLGLYDHPIGTFVVEAVMFAVGVGMYLRTTTARDAIGRWALGSFLVLVSLLYVSSFFAPPPPNPRIMALANSLVLLFLLWAAWADRHRTANISQ